MASSIYGSPKMSKKQYKSAYESLSKKQSEEDPFADYNKYQDRIAQEAARLRTEAEQSGAKAREQATQMINNPPEGLTQKEKENYRNQHQSQIQRDLSNYNRMLQGQQSVKGVRGGATQNAQMQLQRMARDATGDFERNLFDLDQQTALKKLAAQFSAMQGGAAENALTNQTAWDKIMGYLQNQNQRKLAQRADDFFYKL